MIKQEREMRIEVKKQVREGKGEVTFTYLLEQQDYEGIAPLVTTNIAVRKKSLLYYKDRLLM